MADSKANPAMADVAALLRVGLFGASAPAPAPDSTTSVPAPTASAATAVSAPTSAPAPSATTAVSALEGLNFEPLPPGFYREIITDPAAVAPDDPLGPLAPGGVRIRIKETKPTTVAAVGPSVLSDEDRKHFRIGAFGGEVQSGFRFLYTPVLPGILTHSFAVAQC
jgi:hypothetical protein